MTNNIEYNNNCLSATEKLRSGDTVIKVLNNISKRNNVIVKYIHDKEKDVSFYIKPTDSLTTVLSNYNDMLLKPIK